MSKPNFITRPIACCLTIITVAALAASIGISEWSSYLLHQLSTLLGVALLLLFTWRAKVTNTAFIFATVFILVHILGARYLYSYVPYNEWIQALTGFDLNAAMGWQRNMYDRLVHFSFGLLLLPFFIEVFRYYFPNSSLIKLAVLAIMFNMASSMFYELIEFGIAMTMSPEEAENYNGQQGDVWDAHKDMAIALVGGLITWGVMAIKSLTKRLTLT